MMPLRSACLLELITTEIVTGRICRGRSGPIAIETKLGWVLSGPVPG